MPLSGFVAPNPLQANVPALAYSGPPVGQVGIIDVRAVNRGGGGLCRISIAISPRLISGLIDQDWVAYEIQTAEFAEYEKIRLQVFPGEKVFFKSSLSFVNMRADGYERIGTGVSVSAAPAAGQIVTLFTCPANSTYTGSVLVCNRAAVNSRVSIRVTSLPGNDVSNSGWITSGRLIAGNSQFEKYGFTLQPGESAYYLSDSGNTSVRGQFLFGG